MFRFKCVMWFVILGAKYQVKGYSNKSPAKARCDAWDRMFKLLDDNRVPKKATIQKEGVEFYEFGKPCCEDMWINPQARSPWADAWI